jgi:hypothetical protein
LLIDYLGRGEYEVTNSDHPLYSTTLIGCASKIRKGKVRPPIVIDFEVLV